MKTKRSSIDFGGARETALKGAREKALKGAREIALGGARKSNTRTRNKLIIVTSALKFL